MKKILKNIGCNVTLLCALCASAFLGQAQVPPVTPQPVLKVTAKKSTHATLTKPATALRIAAPAPSKPVQFLAISRGPSPYDDMINVQTVLYGTATLDGAVAWRAEQSGRTNQFTATNNLGFASAHYFKMAFEINTNL